MSRVLPPLPRRAGALLVFAALLAACKGGAASGAPGASSAQNGVAGANQNAVWGGGPGATGASQRTDLPPDLVYPEERLLRVEREFESWYASGECSRVAEVLYSDGAGRLLVEAPSVWDEKHQVWTTPHPLLGSLYQTRSFFLTRHRDLHLHARGLLANYRWETLPGSTTVAGRDCTTTRAVSLRGLGAVDLVHETATGLLLGWTVYESNGVQPLMRLRTTAIDENPNLAGVVWATDDVSDQAYDADAHDALLRFVPRGLDYPPPGFYREKAVVADARGVTPAVSFVYLEHWTDGLRTLFVMQHELRNLAQTGSDMTVARWSREGGIVAVESDFPDRRVGAVGMLPASDVLMVVGDLRD